MEERTLVAPHPSAPAELSLDQLRPMLATTGAGADRCRLVVRDQVGRGAGARPDARPTPPVVSLRARSGRDVTRQLPGAGPGRRARRPSELPAGDLILDGEIVALDPDTGRPDFGRLQQRMHVQDLAEAARLAGRVPATYLVFDLLQLGGHAADPALRAAPGPARGIRRRCCRFRCLRCSATTDRRCSRRVARSSWKGSWPSGSIRPTNRDSGPASWIKTKNMHRQEFVIGGWEPGEGNRSGHLGSILLGVQAAETQPSDRTAPLVYCGQVGTGFTDRALRELHAQLIPAAPRRQPVRRGAEAGGPERDMGRTATGRRGGIRRLDR